MLFFIAFFWIFYVFGLGRTFNDCVLIINFFLLQEAGIKTEEGRKEPFTELNYILDCLKQKNLEPALEWATKHKEALLAQVYTQSKTQKKFFVQIKLVFHIF